jgi:hypothetical protein
MPGINGTLTSDILMRDSTLFPRRVLGQKAVARVNGIATGLFGGVDYFLYVQVRFARRRRTNMHGLIGHQAMLAANVGVGIDGDRGNPQHSAGVDYPDGYFGSIGDEYLIKKLFHTDIFP